MTKIKCLTVCQPFAWAIFHADKRVENRPWRTSYRGTLAIHAGLSRKWFKTARGLELPVEWPDEEEVDYGQVIGTVEIVDCIAYPRPLEQLTIDTQPLQEDPHAFGPYCWMLENPQLFSSPFEATGRQRLYDVEIPGETNGKSHQKQSGGPS